MKTIVFGKDNSVALSPKETIEFIKEDNRITILFEHGFHIESNTKDVFEGIYGAEKMEDIPFLDAFDGVDGVSHTFFLKNPAPNGFENFSDKELVKRLIEDGFWTRIHLNERPTVNNQYATIMNTNWQKYK